MGRFQEEGIHLWSAKRNAGELGKLRSVSVAAETCLGFVPSSIITLDKTLK